MKVEFDKDVEATYVKIREGEVASTKGIGGILVDLDQNGRALGVEFLEAGELVVKSAVNCSTC